MVIAKIDKASAEPILLQVRVWLKKAISLGTLAPGQKLPSENELSLGMGIHRQTLHGVLKSLAAEGLLQSHPGRGWFVCAHSTAELRIALFCGSGLGAEGECGLYPEAVENAAPYRIRAIAVSQFRAADFDGALWSSPLPEVMPEVERIARQLPLLVTNRTLYGSDIPYVAINQYSGSRDIVARLFQAGHRNVGCVTLDYPYRYVNERLRGFRDAVHAAGFPPEEAPMLRLASDDLQSQYVRDFLERNPDVTALFVAGEVMQTPVVEACDELGRGTVLALYDDYKGSDGRRFITVRQPHRTRCELSIRQLLRMIAGERIGSITITPDIIDADVLKTERSFA